MTSPVRRWTPWSPLIALFPTIVFPIFFPLAIETDFTLDPDQKISLKSPLMIGSKLTFSGFSNQ